MTTPKNEIFFLGNGPLAEATLAVLKPHFNILFHARTKEDLAELIRLKTTHPSAPAVLASFGVIIKQDLLDLFESTGGILNIHPSLLPKYRGPSPIESALLNGDTTFGVSIMKLAKAMDAGPIYYQTTLDGKNLTKSELYTELATLGATWLIKNLFNLPTPVPQDDNSATYCQKLDRSMSPLDPKSKTAPELYNQIRALATWPKSTYTFYNKECIIHSAHISDHSESPLSLLCKDGKYLTIDELQPAGKKSMPAAAFLNGYAK
ncbi:methionyl-tRNA formyltransferase [Candidatus Saccharibacteria bacterium]|nr:methionyl-tRNA formyltransferase [Candidatus Saccharibacteria bacterium]